MVRVSLLFLFLLVFFYEFFCQLGLVFTGPFFLGYRVSFRQLAFTGFRLCFFTKFRVFISNDYWIIRVCRRFSVSVLYSLVVLLLGFDSDGATLGGGGLVRFDEQVWIEFHGPFKVEMMRKSGRPNRCAAVADGREIMATVPASDCCFPFLWLASKKNCLFTRFFFFLFLLLFTLRSGGGPDFRSAVVESGEKQSVPPSGSLHSNITEFYWSILGFTVSYWVLLGFTGFYWVLLGFTGFYWVYLVLLGFTRFYWVLLGLLGFTGF